MNRRRKHLPIWPFASLYVATLLAMALHWAATKFGSAAWFPAAIGIVAACIIVAFLHLAAHALTDPKIGRSVQAGSFIFLPAVMLVGVFFLDRHEIFLICSVVLTSLVFLAAGILTAFDLPPMGKCRLRNRCPKCYCKLDHWPGRQCPECRCWVAADPTAGDAGFDADHI